MKESKLLGTISNSALPLCLSIATQWEIALIILPVHIWQTKLLAASILFLGAIEPQLRGRSILYLSFIYAWPLFLLGHYFCLTIPIFLSSSKFLFSSKFLLTLYLKSCKLLLELITYMLSNGKMLIKKAIISVFSKNLIF